MTYTTYKEQYDNLPPGTVILDECGSIAVVIGSYIEEWIQLRIYVICYMDCEIRESHAMYAQWQIGDEPYSQDALDELKDKARQSNNITQLSPASRSALGRQIFATPVSTGAWI